MSQNNNNTAHSLLTRTTHTHYSPRTLITTASPNTNPIATNSTAKPLAHTLHCQTHKQQIETMFSHVHPTSTINPLDTDFEKADTAGFNGWVSLSYEPDGSARSQSVDAFAFAKEIVDTAVEYIATPGGKRANVGLKLAFHTMSKVVEAMTKERESRAEEREEMMKVISDLSAGLPPPEASQRQLETDNVTSVQNNNNTLDNILLRLEQIEEQCKANREMGMQANRANQKLTATIENLIDRIEEPQIVSSPSQPNNDSLILLDETISEPLNRAATQPNLSKRTPSRKPTIRKGRCPIVEIKDEEDLTSEGFKAKLTELLHSDHPFRVMHTIRWNGKSTHRVLITPLGYQKLANTDLGRGIVWTLGARTKQCQKCFLYDHGTAEHPTNAPALCSRCGEAKHQGRCTAPGRCCACRKTGHAANSTRCPTKCHWLNTDISSYDLTSGHNTIDPPDIHKIGSDSNNNNNNNNNNSNSQNSQNNSLSISNSQNNSQPIAGPSHQHNNDSFLARAPISRCSR